MGKKSVTAELEDEILEDDVQEEGTDEKAKEAKALRFFSRLKTEESFEVMAYKVGERGKKELLDRWENREIDPLTDLRDIYGGGTYALYLRKFDGTLIDSTIIRIAPKPVGISTPVTTVKEGFSEEQFLERMLKYKMLFGTDEKNNDNTIMLKMIEMQNAQSEKLTKMMMDSERRIAELQQRSTEQMTGIIEKMSSKKTDFSELKDIMSLVEEIRGDSGEKSALDGLISQAPAVIGQFLSQPNASALPATVTATPTLSKIEQWVNSMNADFIGKVTKENAQTIIDGLCKNNSGVITYDEASAVVAEILKRKGL